MEGAFGQEAGAVGNAVFVEGYLWMMEEVAVVLAGVCAEEVELSGNGAGIEGEVLADEIGLTFGEVLLPKYFFVYGGEFFVQGDVVQQAGIICAEVEFDGAMMVGFELFEEGFEAADLSL